MRRIFHCPSAGLKGANKRLMRSRRTASLKGFFDLSQVFDGPLRYGASIRFETIPSSPMRQACSNTFEPSYARSSLKRIACVALLVCPLDRLNARIFELRRKMNPDPEASHCDRAAP